MAYLWVNSKDGSYKHKEQAEKQDDGWFFPPLLWGGRERETPHTRGHWYLACSCVACTNPSMLILLQQFNASVQVPDRNFQLMMEKVTGSCHTAMPGLFCATEHLATFPACFVLGTGDLQKGKSAQWWCVQGANLINFNSYQTLSQNKSPEH